MRQLNVRAGATASYSPFYSFGTFLLPHDPSTISIPATEQNVVRLETLSAGGSGGLTWSPTPRNSFDLGASADYITTPEHAYRLRSQGASGSFRRRLTRYSHLRLGYGYRVSETGLNTVPVFAAHDLNAGFGYHRPLSFSRRTVVGFDMGTTIVSQSGARTLYVTGDASLSHQLSRQHGDASWTEPGVPVGLPAALERCGEVFDLFLKGHVATQDPFQMPMFGAQ